MADHIQFQVNFDVEVPYQPFVSEAEQQRSRSTERTGNGTAIGRQESHAADFAQGARAINFVYFGCPQGVLVGASKNRALSRGVSIGRHTA